MSSKEFVKTGDILNNQFKIIKLIDSGAYGTVYKCLDTNKKTHVAMKVEANIINSESKSKIELDVLKILIDKQNVAQLIYSEKKKEYTFIVMNLLGKNLFDLMNLCGTFKLSTIARIGIQLLYGLKNLHDAGFIHRDIKPENIAIGRGNKMRKFIYLLDFGLCRRFKDKENPGKIIPPRTIAPFCGTLMFSSLNAQNEKEQGRGDDLISLVYVLSDFSNKLPWSSETEENEMRLFKEKFHGKDLFPTDKSLADFFDYVKTLKYEDEPNYEKLFQYLNIIIKENNVKFSDPYEWETILDKAEKPNVKKSLKRKAKLDDFYTAKKFKNFESFL
ncbi:Asator [Strongyloides ratti]|uniref:Asator n=1 Tax=Strongyloides ratti TaxID=34506 RepID=A0A090MP31_STRRB|nr:Asator [Strongyloides ratti]CEF59846.1 Asator [Strongyloides ratti]